MVGNQQFGANSIQPILSSSINPYVYAVIVRTITVSMLLCANVAIAQGTNREQIDGKMFVDAALKYQGKVVGEGGCADFVSQVLVDTQGKSLELRPKSITEKAKEKDLGYILPDRISVWGATALNPLGKRKASEAVTHNYKAGQILQFENCRFEKPDRSQFWIYPHHTAIIKSANGPVVVLLHQNAPIGTPVHEDTLDLSLKVDNEDGTKGTLKAYFPLRN